MLMTNGFRPFRAWMAVKFYFKAFNIKHLNMAIIFNHLTQAVKFYFSYLNYLDKFRSYILQFPLKIAY